MHHHVVYARGQKSPELLLCQRPEEPRDIICAIAWSPELNIDISYARVDPEHYIDILCARELKYFEPNALFMVDMIRQYTIDCDVV